MNYLLLVQELFEVKHCLATSPAVSRTKPEVRAFPQRDWARNWVGDHPVVGFSAEGNPSCNFAVEIPGCCGPSKEPEEQKQELSQHLMSICVGIGGW